MQPIRVSFEAITNDHPIVIERVEAARPTRARLRGNGTGERHERPLRAHDPHHGPLAEVAFADLERDIFPGVRLHRQDPRLGESAAEKAFVAIDLFKGAGRGVNRIPLHRQAFLNPDNEVADWTGGSRGLWRPEPHARTDQGADDDESRRHDRNRSGQGERIAPSRDVADRRSCHDCQAGSSRRTVPARSIERSNEAITPTPVRSAQLTVPGQISGTVV
jgi:hypothetical protein